MNGSLTLQRATGFLAICCLLSFAGTGQAQAVLDQWYDSSCTQSFVGQICNHPGCQWEVAQTFLAGTSGPLTRVDVFMNGFGNGQTYTMYIRNTVAGVPTATVAPVGVLATSTVPAAAVPALPGWVTFLFAAPTTVCAGQTYAIDLSMSPDPIGGAWWVGTFWFGPVPPGSGYPQGSMYRRNGPGAWTNNPGQVTELGFRTFVGNAPYPAVPAPCTPSPAPYAGPPAVGCGPSQSGSGGAPSSSGEGSFASDPPVPPPAGSEGSFGFGAHIAASSLQGLPRPPVLAGPFLASLPPVPFGVAAAPLAGTSLQVFNVSFQNPTQASASTEAAADSSTVLVWLLIVGLGAAAALALGWAIYGLASS